MCASTTIVNVKQLFTCCYMFIQSKWQFSRNIGENLICFLGIYVESVMRYSTDPVCSRALPSLYFSKIPNSSNGVQGNVLGQRSKKRAHSNKKQAAKQVSVTHIYIYIYIDCTVYIYIIYYMLYLGPS